MGEPSFLCFCIYSGFPLLSHMSFPASSWPHSLEPPSSAFLSCPCFSHYSIVLQSRGCSSRTGDGDSRLSFTSSSPSGPHTSSLPLQPSTIPFGNTVLRIRKDLNFSPAFKLTSSSVTVSWTQGRDTRLLKSRRKQSVIHCNQCSQRNDICACSPSPNTHKKCKEVRMMLPRQWVVLAGGEV